MIRTALPRAFRLAARAPAANAARALVTSLRPTTSRTLAPRTQLAGLPQGVAGAQRRWMSVEGGEPVTIPCPAMGDSISEGTIAKWHKQPGDQVEMDEVETDKVTVEIRAPDAGVIETLCCPEGDTILVGADLFKYLKGATGGKGKSAASKAAAFGLTQNSPSILLGGKGKAAAGAPAPPAPKAAAPAGIKV
ncbi:single hybrid motif-containing protein [Baffinella frigidus]|nr:single hybrid motif-containing protein [Cryptophyta sp. CCMP2293]